MLTRDEYTLAVSEWQASLSDVNVRSLAFDFCRGRVDEDTRDAFLEFRRRWPGTMPGGYQSGKNRGRKKKAHPEAPAESPADRDALNHAARGPEAPQGSREVDLEAIYAH